MVVAAAARAEVATVAGATVDVAWAADVVLLPDAQAESSTAPTPPRRAWGSRRGCVPIRASAWST